MSISYLHPKLRIVVLRESNIILSQTQNEAFKDLYFDLLQMKLRGYEKEYPAGVLPIDTTDFIATHILYCEEIDGRLKPLSGFKSTSLESCLTHRLNFPGLSLVQAAEAKPHIEALQNIVTRCTEEDKSLCYTGSWTILPEIRENKVLSKQLVQMFYASYVFYHLESKVDEIITGGTIRFKADKLLGSMGHDILSFDQQPLPPIQVKHLFGENVQVLHLKKFTDQAIQRAGELRSMWENRIEINSDSVAEILIRKRAG